MEQIIYSKKFQIFLFFLKQFVKKQENTVNPTPLNFSPDLGPVGGAEAEAPHVAEDEEAAPGPGQRHAHPAAYTVSFLIGFISISFLIGDLKAS
jgi:hypothetical protein